MDNHVCLSVRPSVEQSLCSKEVGERVFTVMSSAAQRSSTHSWPPSSSASWSLRATTQSLPSYDGDCDANCDCDGDGDSDCDFSKKRDRLPAVQVAARAQNRLYSAG